MSNEPIRTPLPRGAVSDILAIMDNYARAHAAAVSAAECEPLMAEIEALRQDGSRLTAVTAAKDAEIAQLKAELGDLPEAQAMLMTQLKELRADNTRLQNEVVMPLRERIKVLEDALRHVDGCLSINDYGDYALLSLFDAGIVRAALGDAK